MASKKPMVNFVIDDDLLNRVDEFRFVNYFESRAAAMKWLLDWALKQNPKPPKPLYRYKEENQL